MERQDGNAIYSAMQDEAPYATFKKTVLGMVYVRTIDPFTQQVDHILMKGNPDKNEEGCFLEVWSVKEYQFVLKYNKQHFENGFLREVKRPTQSKTELSEVGKANSLSDKELQEVLDSKWLKLTNTVNKMTSEAPVAQLLRMAKDQDKSVKTVQFLEAKLSELQQKA